MRQEPRVLVCEDDDAIRKLVEVILHRCGCSPELARDGVEAIRALEAGSFSLVLLDLLMPRQSGYGVLSFLENRKPHLLSRVIVTTAFPHAFNEKLPVAALLRKPFDVTELEVLVRRIVREVTKEGSDAELRMKP